MSGKTNAGTPFEVLRAFLALGLTSFGGPIAHLGYFRTEFVERRKWISDSAYSELVALCQFLPGPASSQVGFALGLMRAGWLGALAAFVGFTLPSVVALVTFAYGVRALDGPLAQGALAGLKIVAVAIVAQAVLGMARNLCPDAPRASIAVLAVGLLAVVPGSLGMIAAIVLGAGIWAIWGRTIPAAIADGLTLPVSRRIGLLAGLILAGGLVTLPLLANSGSMSALADAMFRAGALVFGGGHVVLPLLQTEFVATGWVSPSDFIAGYGAAQAVPGPLFTFGSYLGAVAMPDAPILGASLATLAIFAPGFLVLVAVLPFWQGVRQNAGVTRAVAGANAAVVGVLGAALYDPIFTSTISDLRDLTLALACFVALVVWRVPPVAVVVAGALGGIVLAQ
jgi:chromate transporter